MYSILRLNGVPYAVQTPAGVVAFNAIGNAHWNAFAKWNSEQQTPLDLSVWPPDPVVIDPDLTLAVQILKADIPASWKTSTNAQQRIAWALRRVLIEVRNELREG